MKGKECLPDKEYIDLDELKLWKANVFWKYSLILTGIVIIFIITYIFFEDSTVGSYLGFAGTILSIVLSVMAILITLIDVAGQKGQVLEISRSADKLRKITNKQNQLYEENYEKFNSLINTRLIEIINDLKDTIKGSETESGEIINHKLNNILNELENTVSSKSSKDNRYLKNNIKKIYCYFPTTQEYPKEVLDEIKQELINNDIEVLKIFNSQYLSQSVITIEIILLKANHREEMLTRKIVDKIIREKIIE